MSDRGRRERKQTLKWSAHAFFTCLVALSMVFSSVPTEAWAQMQRLAAETVGPDGSIIYTEEEGSTGGGGDVTYEGDADFLEFVDGETGAASDTPSTDNANDGVIYDYGDGTTATDSDGDGTVDGATDTGATGGSASTGSASTGGSATGTGAKDGSGTKDAEATGSSASDSGTKPATPAVVVSADLNEFVSAVKVVGASTEGAATVVDEGKNYRFELVFSEKASLQFDDEGELSYVLPAGFEPTAEQPFINQYVVVRYADPDGATDTEGNPVKLQATVKVDAWTIKDGVLTISWRQADEVTLTDTETGEATTESQPRADFVALTKLTDAEIVLPLVGSFAVGTTELKLGIDDNPFALALDVTPIEPEPADAQQGDAGDQQGGAGDATAGDTDDQDATGADDGKVADDKADDAKADDADDAKVDEDDTKADDVVTDDTTTEEPKDEAAADDKQADDADKQDDAAKADDKQAADADAKKDDTTKDATDKDASKDSAKAEDASSAAKADATEAAPTKTVYTYEDAQLVVTATLDDPTAIPDDAVLQVKPITATSSEYSYDTYMEALNESAGATDDAPAYTEENTLLYDVAFIQTDPLTGKQTELQPEEGAVTVRFEFKSQQLSNQIGIEEPAEVDVIHLPIVDSAKAETTAASTDISASDVIVEPLTAGAVSTTGTESFEVIADSFSAFAVTNAGLGVQAVSNTYDVVVNINPTGLSIADADGFYLFLKGKDDTALDGKYNLQKLQIGSGQATVTIPVQYRQGSGIVSLWQDGNGNTVDTTGIMNASDVEVYLLKAENGSVGMNQARIEDNCVWLGDGAPIKNYGIAIAGTTQSGTAFTSTINLEQLQVAGALTPFDILGNAAEYGIVADRYEQLGHTETNFAVNSYYTRPNDNIDIDGSGDAIVPFKIYSIDDGSYLWLSEKTNVPADIYVTQAIKNNNQVYITSPKDAEIIVVDPPSAIQQEVYDMLIAGANTSNTLAGNITISPKVKEGANHYTLDTTAFPDNTTIYVNADGIANVIGTVGGLKIDKLPGQSIVFNFYQGGETENSKLEIAKFSVDPHDGGIEVDSHTAAVNGDAVWNARIDQVIFEHITFNAPNAKYVNLNIAAGLFLLPSAVEVTQENGAGWILAGGTVHSESEWHFYRHERHYKAKGSFTLNAFKKIRDGAGNDVAYENRNFAFNLYQLSGDGGTRTELVDTATASGTTGQITFQSIQYTHSQIGQNDGDSKTFYYEMVEVIPQDAVNAAGKKYSECTEAEKSSGTFSFEGISYTAEPIKLQVVATNRVTSDTQGNIDVAVKIKNADGQYVVATETSGTVFAIGDFYNQKTSVTTQFYVHKNSNYNWGLSDSFDFVLTPGTNTANVPTPMPAGTVNGEKMVSVSRGSAASFGSIKYETAGTYTYTVREVVPGNAVAMIHNVKRTYAEAVQDVGRLTSADIEAADWLDADGIHYDAKPYTVTATVSNGSPMTVSLQGVKDGAVDNSFTTANPVLTFNNRRDEKGSLKVRKKVAVDRIEYKPVKPMAPVPPDPNAPNYESLQSAYQTALSKYNDEMVTYNRSIENQSYAEKYISYVDGVYTLSIYPRSYASGETSHTVTIAIANGEPVSATVDGEPAAFDSNGYVEVKGLAPGYYNCYEEQSQNPSNVSIFGTNQMDLIVTAGKSGTAVLSTGMGSWRNNYNTGALKIQKAISQNETGQVSQEALALIKGDYEFGVYTDEGCTVPARDADGNAITVTLTIDESYSQQNMPTSEEIEGLKPGTYFVKELTTKNYVTPASNPVEIAVPARGIGEAAVTCTITNKITAGGFDVTKTVESTLPEDHTKGFTFTATLSDTSISGTFGTYGPSNTADRQPLVFTNGVATFTLKDGETASAQNLPVGIGYTVEEATAAGFTTTITLGTVTEGKATGEVKAQHDNNVFKNERLTGGFELSKELVSDKTGDDVTEFVFNISLSDTTFAGGTIAYSNGTESITAPEGSAISFTNGAAQVKLKGGQKATVTGLPRGITYSIDEVENNSFSITRKVNDTSVASVKDLSVGAVINNILFTNTRIPGELDVTKTVSSADASDQSKLFYFRVTLEGIEGSGTKQFGGVTFTKGTDDKWTGDFTLTGGDTKKFTDLPTGVTYTVDEYVDAARSAAGAPRGWVLTKSGSTTGTITTAIATANFTNTKDDGSLTVIKTVESPSGADKNKEFRFVVTLYKQDGTVGTDADIDTSVNGTYGTQASTVPAPDAGRWDTTMTFENGVATFTLKDGQYKTATGLPNGVKYKVVEETANGGTYVSEGFTTEYTDAEGAIANRKSAIASVKNKRETSDITLSKSVVSPIPAEQSQVFFFNIQLSDSTVNGIYDGVTFTNGAATNIQVSGGSERTISGLPKGVTYTITEVNASNMLDNFTTKNTVKADKADSTGTTTDGVEATGTIGTHKFVEFENTRIPAPITISKAVVSDVPADHDQYFDFTIELNNHTISGEFDAVITSGSGNSATTTNAKVSFENGVSGQVVYLSGAGESATVDLTDPKIRLHDDQQITINGLPKGTGYTVVEAVDALFETQSTNATGTLGSADNLTAAFTNTRKTGELELQKTVVSTTNADKNKDFEFTVTLKQSASGETLGIDKTYTATKKAAGGTPSSVSVTFENGVSTSGIKLKHGETLTIADLPIGVYYEVTEKAESSAGFVVTKTGETGEISATKAIAHYTNSKQEGGLIVYKRVESPVAADKTKDFAFTITLLKSDGTTDTSFHNETYGTYGPDNDPVTFTEGVANFTLADGQSATVTGLPVGTKYEVNETLSDGDDQLFTTTWSSETHGGTIDDATATITATNTRKRGNIELTKEVVSAQENDASRDFYFRVKLSDTSISGTFGDLTFTNGVADFTLRKGQKVSTANKSFATTEDGYYTLPVGVTYEVYEYKTAARTEPGEPTGYALLVSSGTTRSSVDISANGATGSIADKTTDSFTFTNTREETKARVKKVWQDDNNKDGIRPPYIQVEFKANDVTVTSVRLDDNNSWTYTMPTLPKFAADGSEITYSWSEPNVPGYTPIPVESAQDPGDDSFTGTVTTITNTHVPEYVKAKVIKVWDDDGNQDGVRPTSLTVKLMADNAPATWPEATSGHEKGDPIVITLSPEDADTTTGNWESAVIENLPKYRHGQLDREGNQIPITYTWAEVDLPSDYVLVSSVSSNLTEGTGNNESVVGTITTLTNKHSSEETTAQVKKVWVDKNNRDGVRPNKLTVTLQQKVGNEPAAPVTWKKGMGYGSEADYGEGHSGTVVSFTFDVTSDTWSSGIVTGLPKKSNGQDITYTWVEGPATLGTGSDEVTYSFAGDKLTRNGNADVYYTLTTSTDNTGTITTLTNTYTPEDTSTTVHKDWRDNNDQDGVRPTRVTVILLANGNIATWPEGATLNGTPISASQVGQQVSVVLTGDSEPNNAWKATIANLPKKADGVDIEYTWYEVSAEYSNGNGSNSTTIRQFVDEVVNGTTVRVIKDNEGNIIYALDAGQSGQNKTTEGVYELVNTHTPELTTASIRKVWDDNNNQDGVRPTALNVQLFRRIEGSTPELAVEEEVKWAEGMSLASDALITPTTRLDTDPVVVTLTSATAWVDTVNGLPKKSGGKDITYFWKEVSAKLSDGTTVVNFTETSDHKWVIKNGNGTDAKIIYENNPSDEAANYTRGVVTTITNTHTPETTWVQVEKLWKGDTGHESARPTKLTIGLLANGENIKWASGMGFGNDSDYGANHSNNWISVTLTPDSNGKWTSDIIYGLPRYENGQEIEYLWVEKTFDSTKSADYNADALPSDYGLSNYTVRDLTLGDGTLGTVYGRKTDLENTYNVEHTGAYVKKVWNDNNNQDGVRPESLRVKLTQTIDGQTTDVNWAAGMELGSGSATPAVGSKVELVLNDGNSWSDSVSGLRTKQSVEEGGKPITYSWVEVSATLTNNETYTYSSEKNGLVDSQNKVIYTLTNVGTTGIITTLTNTHNYEPTSSKVHKEWVDNDNQDVLRPEGLVVMLVQKANGASVATPAICMKGVEVSWDNNLGYGERNAGSIITTTLNEANNWSAEVTGLPMKSGGQNIEYSWVEINPPSGYTMTKSALVNNVWEIENTHTPELTSSSIVKIWGDQEDQDGVRPDKITVQLFADGAPVQWGANMSLASEANAAESPTHSGNVLLTLSAANTWADRVDGLPRYKKVKNETTGKYERHEIAYTWQEISGTYVNGNAETTYQFVDDQDGESGPTKRVLKDSDGAVVYTLKTIATSGVITALTNEHKVEETTAKVKKVWVDGANQDGIRPSSITVKLQQTVNGVTSDVNWKSGLVYTATTDEQPASFANGSPIAFTFDTTSNTWQSGVISHLPKKSGGQDITYTWVESATGNETAKLAKYTLSTSTDNTGTITTLTNTYKPETTTAQVKKIWADNQNQDGKRPASITFTLKSQVAGSEGKSTVKWSDSIGYGSDDNYGATQIESATEPITYKDISFTITSPEIDLDTWQSELITGLPKKSNGAEITYSWDEQLTWSDSQTATSYTKKESVVGTLTTITNSYSPTETSSTVLKVWNDADNQDALRARTLTVRLLADGVAARYMNGLPVADVILSSANDWTATIDHLPMYANGRAIEYTWVETEVPTGYTFNASESGLKQVEDVWVYKLVNDYTPQTVTAQVSKVWQDEGNKSHRRPGSLTVKLQQTINGETSYVNWADGMGYGSDSTHGARDGVKGTGITFTIDNTASDTWTSDVITGLPKYAVVKSGSTITAVGVPITYSWVEECEDADDTAKLQNYTLTTTTADAKSGDIVIGKVTTLTNTLQTGDLEVRKQVVSNVANDQNAKLFTFKVQLVDQTITGEYGGMNFVNHSDEPDPDVYATFQLKHDGSKIATGLPVGVGYTVTETAENGFTTTWRSSTRAAGTSGTIREGATPVITAVNSRVYGGFTVQKSVISPNAADHTQQFRFKVQLSDGTINTDNDHDYGGMSFTNGVAEFDLTDNQSMSTYGLPVGTTYTVTETAADGFSTQWTGTAAAIDPATTSGLSNQTATYAISATTTPTIRFINTRIDGPLTINKRVISDIPAEATQEFTFRITLTNSSGATLTGDAANKTYSGVKFTNGVSDEFTIRGGASKTIEKLPVGTKYVIEEVRVDDAVWSTTKSGDTGTVSADGTSATFINTHRKGGLEVTKQVVSNTDSDKTNAQQFYFRVTLTDTSGRPLDIDGHYGGMDFTDGVADFTLAHNQMVPAYNLPVGIKYTVEEYVDSTRATAGAPEGWVVTSTGTTTPTTTSNTVTGGITGEIVADAVDSNGQVTTDNTAMVTFTNTKDEGGLIIRKVVAKGLPSDDNTEFSFVVSLYDKTGATQLSNFKGTFTGTFTRRDDSAAGGFAEQSVPLTFADGLESFTLKNDESLKIDDLPAGTVFRIFETANPDFVTTWSGTSGVTETDENTGLTIWKGTVAKNASDASALLVTATNTRQQGELEVSKTVVSSVPADQNKDFNFTVTLTDENDDPVFGTYAAEGMTAHTFDANGQTTVAVKGGRSELITGLPLDTRFVVTEASAPGFTLTGKTGDTGVIRATRSEATFENTRESGDLEVSKAVISDLKADHEEREFTFTVDLNDAAVTGNFGTYRHKGATETITFTNGSSTFKLSDTEKWKAVNLPAGVNYTVTEESTDGFKLTGITGNARGTIVKDAVSSAGFTNTRETGNLDIYKFVTSSTLSDRDKDFTFTLKLRGLTTAAGTRSYPAHKYDAHGVESIIQLQLTTDDEGVTTAAPVTLKDTEHLTIVDLPRTVVYTVEEVTDPAYVTTWKNQYTDVDTNVEGPTSELVWPSGPITDFRAKARFFNERIEGDLTVSKQVVEPASLPSGSSRKFDFTVTLLKDDNTTVDTSFNQSYGEMSFENGVATFSIGNGESVTAKGLPAGTRYTVAESGNELYTTTINGTTVTADAAGLIKVAGVIVKDEVKTEKFVNKRQEGGLTLSKLLVSDRAGDEDQVFSFTVTFDEAVSGTFVKDDSAHTELPFTGGTAELVLKGGESVTASGLPLGVRYTVTEASDAGFRLNSRVGDTGTIGASAARAVFNNGRLTSDLTIAKRLFSDRKADADQSFTFHATFEGLNDEAKNKTYTAQKVESGMTSTTTIKLTDGKADVTLKGGDSFTIEGLPLGATYTITEEAAEGFKLTGITRTVAARATDQTYDEKATGFIETTPSAVLFTNERETGELSLSKELVASNAISYLTDTRFTFHVRLEGMSDEAANKTYSGVTFTRDAEGNAVSTIVLRGDDTKVIEGLPTGISYTITEEDATGFKLSGITVAKGTTSDDQTDAKEATGTISTTPSEVTFTNDRLEGKLKVVKDMAGDLKTEPLTDEEKEHFVFYVYGPMEIAEGRFNEQKPLSEFTVAAGDTDPSWVISGLPVGTYTVIEQILGELRTNWTLVRTYTYQVDGEETTATLSATTAVKEDETSEVTVTNNYTQDKGRLKLIKTVRSKGQELTEEQRRQISFSIVDEFGQEIEYVSADGTRLDKLTLADFTKVGQNLLTTEAATGEESQGGALQAQADDDAQRTIATTYEWESAYLTVGDYTVTETNAMYDWVDSRTYVVQTKSGEKETTDSGEVNVSKDHKETPVEVKITDTLEPSRLTVSKSVIASDLSDYLMDQDFTFTVTVTPEQEGRKITGTFGDMKFENNVATVKLKANESATAEGLPVGSTFVVTEGQTPGFTLAGKVGDEGTISKSEIEEYQAIFTNKRDEGTLKITKSFEGEGFEDMPMKDLRLISFTVTGPAGFTATKTLDQFRVADGDTELSWIITGLPVGEYQVVETVGEGAEKYYATYSVEDGKTTVEKDETAEIVVTNKFEHGPISATVKKVWDDLSNAFGERPAELKVKLMAGTSPAKWTDELLAIEGNKKVAGDKAKAGDDIVVTLKSVEEGDNEWTATVVELPYYDEEMTLIDYSWAEENVPAGYVLANSSTETARNGSITTTLTNHKLRGKIRLTKTVHTPEKELTAAQREMIKFEVRDYEGNLLPGKVLSLADFTRTGSEGELITLSDQGAAAADTTNATLVTQAGAMVESLFVTPAYADEPAAAPAASGALSAQAETKSYLATTYVWESDWLPLTGDETKDSYSVKETNSMYQWLDMRTYRVNDGETVQSAEGVKALAKDMETTDVWISDTLVPPALVISKELAATTDADAEATKAANAQEFTFTVTLNLDESVDSEAAKNPAWKDATYQGALTTGTTTANSPVKFADGKATVKLKAGQSQSIEYLPMGVTYTVTEAETAGYYLQEISGTGTTDIEKATISDVISTEQVDPHEARFVNAPVQTEGKVDVQLAARKTLSGRALVADEFSFTLTEVDKDGKPVEGFQAQTKRNSATGAVLFDEISFKEEGTYYYEIVEVKGSAANVTYDTHTAKVTVTVAKNDEGKLTARVVYDRDASATFANTYTPPTEEKKTTTTTTTTTAGGGGSSPKTGDPTDLATAGTLSLAGALVLLAGVLRRTRRRRRIS